MLAHLFVKNFAIIDDLTIDFTQGFTIITGESGAGKSVIIKTLSLLTGDRADTSFVKSGKDNATISAEFTHLHSNVLQFLTENALDAQESCLIRRVIDTAGKSKVFINDTPTSLALLKKLAVLLIDISSQNSHQLLLSNTHQMQILDEYAGNTNTLDNITNISAQLHSVEREINAIKNQTTNTQNQLDFLQFQLQELLDLQLNKEELESIEDAYKIATKSQQLLENISQVAMHINSIEKELNTTSTLLESSQTIDSKLENAFNLLSSAQIHLTECNYEVSNYLANFSLENTQELEERISHLYDSARKHQCEIKDLLSVQTELQSQIDGLQDNDTHLLELEEKYQHLFTEYQALSTLLTQNRTKFAQTLSQKVSDTLQEFAMSNAQFNIEITTDTDKITSSGCDEVDFVINTKGEFKSLKKIASGGELSRINLAIAVITSSQAYTPTLVFDEVDTGISGETAKVVATKLQELSQQYQVICITHLPQVASKSNTHILIDNTNNTSTIRYLTADEKLYAIAKMISGNDVTGSTLALAREMVK
jgi:DNA repair protein RecN (Recombination protein N)